MSQLGNRPSPAATAVALRFVGELQAGRRPSIEAALDSVASEEWPGLLQSLLIAEVNHRKSRGETPLTREYLPRFPAHAAIVRSVLPETIPVAKAVPAIPVPSPIVEPMPIANGQPMTAPIPMAVVIPPAFEDFEQAPDPGPIRRRRRKRRLQWLAGTAIVLVIAGAIVFLSLKKRRVDPGNTPQAGGATTVVAGGTTKVPSIFDPKPGPADADRGLAEWIVSLGGRGTLAMDAGGQRPFGPEQPLPKAKFAVTGIVLPAESSGRWTSADLERLRGREKLTSIHINHPSALSDTTLEPLNGLPLRSLELHGANITVTGASIARFANLESLTLLSAPNFADADFAAIGKLTKLSSLSLNSTKITPTGLGELKMTMLRRLSIGENAVLTGEHVRAMVGLPLEEIELHRGLTDDAILEFAVYPNIKRFRALKTTITDAGLKFAAGLGMLEELQITGSSITGAGLEHLEERKGLKVLDLSGSKIDDEGIAKLLGFSMLRELRLAGCPIGDQGVNLLAQVDGVQILDLSNTQVTDNALGILKKHGTLKTLVLTGTRVTPAGIKDFETATPNCKAVFGVKK
jgi:hypothetical protein